MRVYADTSVFGGVFDVEFEKPSKQFFREIDSGRFLLVTSAIVEAEIEPAPDDIREFFAQYANFAELTLPTEEMFILQQSEVDPNRWTVRNRK